ncbi:beta-1,4-mannosyltransferase [Coccidioides immitis RS]|uniref:Chitobiosyldiphosphodolichol beta-mannosyltransferase n=4 Tax=Coccidioides immitis TaxID=5501 RepID=J3KMA3_COCIM|nr:beta-1,4-mannosyltransferase [Coccidioides immitis RS]KMP02343.1 hypothetical protein CIRG_10166 [Coccidioides immitis RMSCC 2394]KMU81306.1 chitobiosyldiphosphodolichol beta-mannosyltransferase [Coccidioides immitis RMSCC 3703]KMU90148.1 chitobiosyldiphosphodolichol beta-mannosyltransferase [Coccidioides immitis H538.4]TPX24608.1 mannosyltransferase [Coccidioides immitis]EAS37522.3 beta-1,4-mannosyltransferase [Coccidioides immitis RS]
MAVLQALVIACLSLLLATTVALVWVFPIGRARASDSDAKKASISVQIVVLGDIGHSPRMQYHAESVAKHGGRVTIIGYQTSPPKPELLSNPLVSIVALPPPPKMLQTKNKVLFPLLAVLKVLQQTWFLWSALVYRSKPAQWMLIQNPPTVPTLVMAQLACWLRNTRLIIDWHNFGYSILAMKLGPRHPMVKFLRFHEMTACRFATAHFCVSKAMARMLQQEINLVAPILVLHDRPPELFQPIVREDEKFAFLTSLPETNNFVKAYRAGRQCELLVSSTSWTPDEDFSIFLDALCQYSTHAATVDANLPDLYVVITGKGPLQRTYLRAIAALTAEGKLRKIHIQCAWLTIQDYAKLLACSSLGVCLHTSSSGVDLPMKVVDMFGAGLPVVAWDRYEAWPELITEGVDGKGFGSAEELSRHLIDLLGEDRSQLQWLRQGARNASKRRWDDEWDPVAGEFLGLTS